MGQYFLPIFLSETDKTQIRAWIEPHTFDYGSKLAEWSAFGSLVPLVLERLLSRGGMFYRTRFVCAGDYADPEMPEMPEMLGTETGNETESPVNLYRKAIGATEALLDRGRDQYGNYTNEHRQLFPTLRSLQVDDADLKTMYYSQYFVNHSKKQYLDMKRYTEQTNESDPIFRKYHPLPLLTAEGNGRGGGDYFGSEIEKVGIWARDVVSFENQIPDGFGLIECRFWGY